MNLQAEWAALLFDGFAAAGVTDVVLSPGSRSTPFVLAAAAHPRLRCHDVIDERSAAFFALGQARVTGRPSLLLCTSGSAGAHYYPAVVEAAAARVPLLCLTADRPLELHDCGANQTIDQTRLYGGFARRFVELGAPEASPEALRALRRAVAQAVLAASWPDPGPVQLNARARKPLEPRPAEGEAAGALAAHASALRAAPVTVHPPRLAPDPQAVSVLAEACLRARRGLIVAGPAPLAQEEARATVAELVEATGFPLLAEAASQLRFGVPAAAPRCDAFDAVLRSPGFRERHAPDLVLQLGAAPTSAGLDAYLAAHPDVPRAVIAPHGWPDPQSTAARIVVADVEDGAGALAAAVRWTRRGAAPEPTAWSAAFTRADAAAWAAIDRELAGDALTEGAVARDVVAGGGLLVLANSLPIREVDACCRGGAGSPDARILSQRGASGIDGLVSGAAGAAEAAEEPVTLLVGDVSFLHDVSGLMAARGRRTPLVVVVVNNDGGRIFEQLPVGEAAGAALGHFTTPHGLELGHAARLYGHRHRRVDNRAALRDALGEARAFAGCTVVEAVVPPHGAAEQQRRLLAAIDAALGEVA